MKIVPGSTGTVVVVEVVDVEVDVVVVDVVVVVVVVSGAVVVVELDGGGGAAVSLVVGSASAVSTSVVGTAAPPAEDHTHNMTNSSIELRNGGIIRLTPRRYAGGAVHWVMLVVNR